MINKFIHVNIYSENPLKVVDFYTQKLGMPIQFEGFSDYEGACFGFIKDAPNICVWHKKREIDKSNPVIILGSDGLDDIYQDSFGETVSLLPALYTLISSPLGLSSPSSSLSPCSNAARYPLILRSIRASSFSTTTLLWLFLSELSARIFTLSVAASSLPYSPNFRHIITNMRNVSLNGLALSLRKLQIVLSSGSSPSISHMTSTFLMASSLKRRDERTLCRYPYIYRLSIIRGS